MTPPVLPGIAPQTADAPLPQNPNATAGGALEEGALSGESNPGALETDALREPAPLQRTPVADVRRGETPPAHGIFRAPETPTDSRNTATLEGIDPKAPQSGSGLDLSFDELDLGGDSRDARAFSLNPRARGSEVSAEPALRVVDAPGSDGTVHTAATSTIPGDAGQMSPETHTRQIAPDQATIRDSILQQLEEESFHLLRTRRNEAEIQLNPPELGRIRLRLSVADASVRGFIEVENPAVRSMLQADLSRLVQSLAQQGLNLGEFDVQLLEERQRGHRGQAKRDPSGGRGWSARPEAAAGPEVEDTPTAPGGSVVDYWM